MKSFQETTQLLHCDESRQRFRDNLVEEARQTGTMLYYQDEQGRSVEEWPATGELYEVRYDPATDKTVRLRRLTV